MRRLSAREYTVRTAQSLRK